MHTKFIRWSNGMGEFATMVGEILSEVLPTIHVDRWVWLGIVVPVLLVLLAKFTFHGFG